MLASAVAIGVSLNVGAGVGDAIRAVAVISASPGRIPDEAVGTGVGVDGRRTLSTSRKLTLNRSPAVPLPLMPLKGVAVTRCSPSV
jgi:hypothetical protein